MGRRQSLLSRMKPFWQLYVLLILPMAYLITFKYVPMLGAQIAFRKFTATGGIWGSPWVGFAYFRKFFSSYQFSRVIGNTLRISIYNLAAGFPLPILVALCLHAMESARYRKIVQTITYVPYFISVVVLVGMVMQLFNPLMGLFATAYRVLFHTTAPNLLGSPGAFPHLFVWSGVWQYAGWNSIIYVAVLSSVDQQLHEAAQLDGANRRQRMAHIDLPAILPTAAILLILNTGRIMDVGFEKTYLMQNSLNLRASEVISTYVYKVGLGTGGGDFSYATAIGLFNSLVNLTLLVTVNAVSKRLGASSLW
ncbi:MAG TPA: ABC transporter permease subunit [Clostridia bacterium]|nr:ABC transporter permease subunit [Clostridia bacterium]